MHRSKTLDDSRIKVNTEVNIRHQIEAISGTMDLSLSHECIEELIDLVKKTSIINERTRNLNLTDIPPAFLFAPRQIKIH